MRFQRTSAMLSSTVLAHGVGRIYQLPVPLSYYLSGSALAVVASFLAVGALGRKDRTAPAPPRRLLGPAAVAVLARVLRILIWVGFALAFVTGVTDNATGFTFAAIWLWVGLVVGLTLLNVVLGGIWRLSDPWIQIAEGWGTREAFEERPIERLAGPVLIYLLFWFELVSGQGFTAGVIAPVLLIYVIYALWVRVKFAAWPQMDPFAIIHEFASRSSPLRTTTEGVFVRSAGADEDDQQPMSTTLFACLFLLLGATSLDNLRETHGWEATREVLILGQMPTLAYDSLALAVLGLPFLLTFKLALRAGGRDRMHSHRTIAWALAPIAIAYVLAHNVSLFMVTLPVWLVTLSDPLSLGWNLLGLNNVLPGFRPSPALVWILEVGLVVGGHVMGVVMAHRITAAILEDDRRSFRSQIPMTLLMTLYTVGTLWLLSLAVVTD